MKKSMKKILASLLALAMIATLVPFAAFAEETVDTSFVFGSSYGSFNNTKVPVSYPGGIGGKAADDTAMAFVYEGEEATADVTRWYYPVTHLDETVYASSGSGPSVHFAFNIYADGGAIARVGYNTSYDLFLWQPDGTVQFKEDGVSKTCIVERGKWHRVGIALNNNGGGRFALYIDGVKLAEKACATWNGNIDAKANLTFGIALGSTKGTVAYDDPMVGFAQTNAEKYNKTVAPDDVVKATDTDMLSVDTVEKTISINSLQTDVSVIAAGLAESFTNESEIRLLTEDMSAEASTVEEAKKVLVKTITGAYDYYIVNEYVKTPIELVGLTKIKENGSTADDNWLSNIIINGNKNVSVYSSNLRNLSCVSSARLIEALESSEGYTLSYVDENKNSAVSDSVDSGFIKASKEGTDDVYIEIVDKYNQQAPVDLTALTLDIRGATTTSATGVAGKSADDTSHGFKATVHSWNPAKYYHTVEDVISINPDGTRTYVFNMYTDGDAIARIALMFGTSAYYVAKWDGSTGDFYGPKGPSNAPTQATAMATTPDLNLETGRWHQVAITMDKGTGGRIEMYVDGKLLQRVIDENLGWNNYSGVGFGIGYEETTGKALFDDIEIYNGFYDAEDANVGAKSATDDFVVDTDNKVIYYQNMTTSSEIVTAALANTNATAAKVYADSTFAAEAAELDNSTNVVMLTSPNGIRYEYYTLKPMSELPAPVITITPSKTIFTVSGKIISNLSGYTMYVATYTNDDTLVSVAPVVIDGSMMYKEFSNKYAFGSGGVKAKVFLWKADQTPLTFAQADALAE